MPTLWGSQQKTGLAPGIQAQKEKGPGAAPDGVDRPEVGKVNITFDNTNEQFLRGT
jgi:hypothetical protein